MAIHHIHMDHISSRFFDSPHLFPEAAEISGQNRRRYLFHMNLCLNPQADAFSERTLHVTILIDSQDLFNKIGSLT
jgi:hypothetical protein